MTAAPVGIALFVPAGVDDQIADAGAFEASGEVRYLHRAETLAHNITVRQAALAGAMRACVRASVREHNNCCYGQGIRFESER